MWEAFRPFTIVHGAVVIGAAIAAWAVVLIGRRCASEVARRRFSTTVGVTGLVVLALLGAKRVLRTDRLCQAAVLGMALTAAVILLIRPATRWCPVVRP